MQAAAQKVETNDSIFVPVVIAAAVFGVVLIGAAGICLFWNRRLRRRLRARAKTGVGGGPGDMVSKSSDGMEMGGSSSTAASKQTWKFSMSDLVKHEEIGAGAFGTVFRATLKGTEVALKVPVATARSSRRSSTRSSMSSSS